MHEKTGVPLATLYPWGEQVCLCTEWQPSHEHFEATNCSSLDHAEAMNAQFIRSNLVALERGLDQPMLAEISMKRRPNLIVLIHWMNSSSLWIRIAMNRMSSA
jgi:hypothetical protein